MSWQAKRESGFRILLVGSLSLVIAFVIYSRLSGANPVPAPQLAGLAYAMLAITAASMAAALYGAYLLFRSEQERTAGGASLMSFITGAFSGRSSSLWKVMAVATIGYGVFFSFLSQILVYRADVSFTEKGIMVPSAEIIQCCGAPGYMPMLTVYFTDHFLLLVIPVNVILAAVVSIMVGFNVALSIHAYRLRKAMQATRTSFVGGLGAATGLFVGCPTCAGSMVSAVLGLGVVGAGASTSALAPFQTAFIAASIPALAIAPFLLARGIRSVSMCK